MRLPFFLTNLQNILVQGVDKIIPKSVTPNQITLTGLVANILLCIVYVTGHLSFGTFLLGILCTQIFDILDGGIARIRDKVTENGKLLDQLTDSISAILLLLAIFVRTGLIDWWWILILALLYTIRFALVRYNLDREYGGYKNALIISLIAAFYLSVDLTLVVQFVALFNLLVIGFAIPNIQNFLSQDRKKNRR